MRRAKDEFSDFIVTKQRMEEVTNTQRGVVTLRVRVRVFVHVRVRVCVCVCVFVCVCVCVS
jgi:hypothetical protein